MLTDNKCRICKQPHLYHEIRDNRLGKMGICFDCLLSEYRKLVLQLSVVSKQVKDLLKLIRNAKKTKHRKK
jgi:hypothetical protein